jgi:hypothetical protein
MRRQRQSTAHPQSSHCPPATTFGPAADHSRRQISRNFEHLRRSASLGMALRAATATSTSECIVEQRLLVHCRNAPTNCHPLPFLPYEGLGARIFPGKRAPVLADGIGSYAGCHRDTTLAARDPWLGA